MTYKIKQKQLLIELVSKVDIKEAMSGENDDNAHLGLAIHYLPQCISV